MVYMEYTPQHSTGFKFESDFGDVEEIFKYDEISNTYWLSADGVFKQSAITVDDKLARGVYKEYKEGGRRSRSKKSRKSKKKSRKSVRRRRRQ